ncbi:MULTISPECIES: hypothetical protein [Methylomonas]|uniref:Late embryogenesis abundant protein n=2 Tax=Methylomonas TaxID=416 RepID=A0A126T615_9GAMM|nr:MULTISPECIES: hypothetical protein [Methylomonas]AMK77533.1 hypothetical protein JT25_013745 [Methylomonas denitrificans]OAI05113.1 hypothetical protein A1342_11910 [Methylomonas methanica]TCV84425.1 hypothetical protein EDE11_10784 [Methylomonas methanica]
MQHKAILFSSLVLVSGAVFAQSAVLEGVAKQAAKDTATSVAPGAVKGVEQAGQAVNQVQQVQQGVQSAPAVLKDQAQDAVKDAAQQKLEQAVPAEVKQGAETLKANKEKVTELKGKVDAAPKSTGEAVKAVKGKAKQKAAAKALDLLN